jgi:hypothetical protein
MWEFKIAGTTWEQRPLSRDVAWILWLPYGTAAADGWRCSLDRVGMFENQMLPLNWHVMGRHP